MKYSNVTLGRGEAVWNKLGGEVGVQRFLRGERVLVEHTLTYQRNQNGHIMVTIFGLNLTGEQEIQRLTNHAFTVGDVAAVCLKSDAVSGYDIAHRLADGQVYRVIIIPGCTLGNQPNTERIKEAARCYGYQIPPAGIIPRLRERLSNAQLEHMGLWHVTALHAPLVDQDNNDNYLRVLRFHKVPYLDAVCVGQEGTWDTNGGFAFLDHSDH